MISDLLNNLPATCLILIITTLILCIFALIGLLVFFFSITSHIDELKTFMINTQFYTWESKEMMYNIRDLTREMRDKLFKEFLKENLPK